MTLRRLSALLLAVIVLAALVGQFLLNGAKPGLEPWGIRAWDLMRYFTILTCGLVGILMAQEALGRRIGTNWHTTATLSIIMVGVIYQLLLAPDVPPTGIDWWPDFGFHIAIPVLTAVWWAVWAAKPLALKSLPFWLLWPFGYCLYALIRGVIGGQYPYFFLDIDQFGLAQVALNIIGLVAVFAATGLLLWLASRALPSVR
jgi:hypothetical protein